MKRNLVILLLVLTISSLAGLSLWYILTQEDSSLFNIIETQPPLHNAVPTDHQFSTEIGEDETLMVLIPESTFFMGNRDKKDYHIDELPGHEVYLDAFWIDCYEVTNGHYKQFVDETGHRVPYLEAEWAKPFNWKNGTYPPGRADYPVVLVSHEDASAYAAWAGKRLPTEAEWEKAARGGLVKKLYPWGDEVNEKQANYFTGKLSTHMIKPVGTLLANPYGIYDIAGNVWEWCADWYDSSYYQVSPERNPKGPEEGRYRVYRGGSWINQKESLRCSDRAKNVPQNRSHVIGFRCAQSSN